MIYALKRQVAPPQVSELQLHAPSRVLRVVYDCRAAQSVERLLVRNRLISSMRSPLFRL
jgi:hypothetical protein